MMGHRESTFPGAGGLELYRQSWRPPEPRASLALVHGFGEHSGRYANLVAFLAVWGFAVHTFDLRGHGRSPGQRGHIDSWDDYRGDLAAFLELVRGEEGERPLFLMGHSMGGLIVLDFVLRFPAGLRGVVASAASLKPVGVAKPHLVLLARLLSRVWPRFPVKVPLEIEAVSRDPRVVEALRDDPLRHDRGSVRWGAESLAVIDWVEAHAADLAVALMLIHGGADRIASPQGTREFSTAVPYPDKQLRIYDGYYHEPHNDLGWEQAVEDVVMWLERHVPA